MEESIWKDAEVISTYTRAQAIEDGVLVDLSYLAREAGFRMPVAVTQGVWEVVDPTEELEKAGQDMEGRAWDMLTILRQAIRTTQRVDEVHFAPLYVRRPGGAPEPIALWAKCGPGDDAEPVITVLLLCC